LQRSRRMPNVHQVTFRIVYRGETLLPVKAAITEYVPIKRGDEYPLRICCFV